MGFGRKESGLSDDGDGKTGGVRWGNHADHKHGKDGGLCIR
jgi:hypothetical protein